MVHGGGGEGVRRRRAGGLDRGRWGPRGGDWGQGFQFHGLDENEAGNVGGRHPELLTAAACEELYSFSALYESLYFNIVQRSLYRAACR